MFAAPPLKKYKRPEWPNSKEPVIACAEPIAGNDAPSTRCAIQGWEPLPNWRIALVGSWIPDNTIVFDTFLSPIQASSPTLKFCPSPLESAVTVLNTASIEPSNNAASLTRPSAFTSSK